MMNYSENYRPSILSIADKQSCEICLCCPIFLQILKLLEFKLLQHHLYLQSLSSSYASPSWTLEFCTASLKSHNVSSMKALLLNNAHAQACRDNIYFQPSSVSVLQHPPCFFIHFCSPKWMVATLDTISWHKSITVTQVTSCMQFTMQPKYIVLSCLATH